MSEGLDERYRRFADDEARGHSPLYEAMARGVAGDREMLGFLLGLPPDKRQPNLFFAAARHVAGTPADFADFRANVLANKRAVAAAMRARRTQTNEPGRCAVLLPILARLHEPLALIEVGASAGLCLTPDRYAYDYGAGRVGDPRGPVFPCRVLGGAPAPTRVPRIAWRAGLDLDPTDPDDAGWLETLVWPEHADRLARLRAALAIAADFPRIVRRGDLTGNLDAILDDAPQAATVVVFHSAVLGYVAGQDARDAFAANLAYRGAVWIGNETPRVFPWIAERAKRPGPPGAFLLHVNGEPMAWTDPHGAWIDWIA
jgi:hypothetical protein